MSFMVSVYSKCCCGLLQMQFCFVSLMLVAIPHQLTFFTSLEHFTQHPGRTDVE